MNKRLILTGVVLLLAVCGIGIPASAQKVAVRKHPNASATPLMDTARRGWIISNVILFLSILLGFTAFPTQTPSQNKSQSICHQYDSSGRSAGKNQASIYVEVCTVPNQEGKPAVSIVFDTKPGGTDAMRLYSYSGTKPVTLDGIYVERNGDTKFILHRDQLEWPSGKMTPLDSIDSKERKKLVDVFEAASALLKGAVENHRILSSNHQEWMNLNLVFDFLFNYRINGKH